MSPLAHRGRESTHRARDRLLVSHGSSDVTARRGRVHGAERRNGDLFHMQKRLLRRFFAPPKH